MSSSPAHSARVPVIVRDVFEPRRYAIYQSHAPTGEPPDARGETRPDIFFRMNSSETIGDSPAAVGYGKGGPQYGSQLGRHINSSLALLRYSLPFQASCIFC